MLQQLFCSNTATQGPQPQTHIQNHIIGHENNTCPSTTHAHHRLLSAGRQNYWLGNGRKVSGRECLGTTGVMKAQGQGWKIEASTHASLQAGHSLNTVVLSVTGKAYTPVMVKFLPSFRLLPPPPPAVRRRYGKGTEEEEGAKVLHAM